ncbi:MAG: energy-coupling factor transporter transmembrane protein EcfT [Ardenticatenaceae bacterium]|nr:energy-coupling factor transporter transmembrane protein EcfT [Ardenticatenaceae bacterium]
MPVGYSIYVDRPSTLHQRIDPRTKLALLFTMFVLALIFNHPLPLALLLAGVIGAGIWAQLSLRQLLPFLLPATWFLILGIVIWPFYIHQGRPLFTILGSTITLDGILFGLAMGLRVALMVAAAGVWMMTTSPQKMTLGLLKMGMPYKAGLAMSTAIRFIPLINAERTTIVEAQRARGLRLERGNPLARAGKSVAVIGPMFLRAIDLAQALAVALDARGFGARPQRSSIFTIEITPTDRLIMFACLAAVIVGLVLRLFGIGVIVKGYL